MPSLTWRSILLNSLIGLLTVFVIASFSPSAAAEQEVDDWQKAISSAIENELKDSGAPSLQVAIGKKGRIIFKSSYGLADIENNVSATNNSKYRTGSVSKWFTSAAVKVLIETGAIDPELPIQIYCPQFPEKQWPITTNNLLTHRSGIRHYIDYDEVLENTKNVEKHKSISRNRDRDLLSSFTRYIDVISPLANFKNDPLLFEPNTNWSYSSLGYRVLACVLEGAAKMNYSEVMDELIFKKASMTDTTKDDAWDIISGRTTGYQLTREKILRRADLRDTSENLPAGGHLSTANDLALFALALNTGKLSPSGNGFEGKAWGDAGKGTIGNKSSWRNAIPSQEYYGEGEMFFPDKLRFWVGHTGRIAGGSAIVVLQPESNVAIAVMTNAKGWNGYISFMDKLKIILEEADHFLQ